MKFSAFQHHRAESVEHAIGLLGRYGDEAKVLAGGQSLLPLMALRLSVPQHLVDVGRIGDPAAATSVADDGATVVTLACRHSTAERSAALAAHQPLLHAAMPWIGHRAVRSRGTLCGSIVHGDPAAELPAVALALDAEMLLVGPAGVRRVPARSFFLGTFETAAGPDEVLTEVRFPAMGPVTGWAFEEVCRRHGDYALAGMATVVVPSGTAPGTVARAAIAMFSLGSTPLRVPEVEALLAGEPVTAELIDQAAELLAGLVDPPDDLHGTSAYRVHLCRLLARRTLTTAARRAGLLP